MPIAALVVGYVLGLAPAVFFVIGFKAKEKHEDTGKFTGRVEVVDPIQMTDRRVRELEEAERNQDSIYSE